MYPYKKIGEFAKMFGITPSTVRYYIQCGFLIPDTKNGQYLFHNGCIRDMRQIMKWKELKLPLKDIHQLLKLSRISNLVLPDDIAPCLELLAAHKKKLEKERLEVGIQVKNIDNLLLDADPLTEE